MAPGRAELDGLVGDLLRSFVLLEQALEPGPLVAALAREVLLGVVQLVLVEIELRLGEIQGVAGVFAQFFHAFLVRLDALLEPGDAVAQLPQGTVGGQCGCGFGFGLAQGRGEGEVEPWSARRQASCACPCSSGVAAKGARFSAVCEQARIHQRLPGRGGILLWSGGPGGIARGVST